MNPFVELARKISLARHRSKVPHAICPLSKCKEAVVLVDGTKPQVQECVDAANAFFSARHINCRIFVINTLKEFVGGPVAGAQLLTRKNVKWYGRSKRSKNHPCVNAGEDLLINLAGPENFTAYYASVCSKAKFKVGVYETKAQLFDVLVSNTESYSQKQVFLQISNIISSVI